MRQQLSSGRCTRRPLPGAEHYIMPKGERPSIDRGGAVGGGRAGMHAHRTEVATKSRLEVAPGFDVEWRAVTHATGKVRSDRSSTGIIISLTSYLRRFLRSIQATLALPLDYRIGHARHTIRDRVGFSLKLIAR